MDEYEAGVHEVEALPRRFLGADVVDAHLDRRAGGRGDLGGVDVGREDLPGRANFLGQPGHHRGAADADLPYAPAGSDAEPLQVPERGGVEERGEGVEALSRLGLPVVEEIPVGSRHAAIIPVAPLVGRGRRSGCREGRTPVGAPVRDTLATTVHRFVHGSSTGGNKAEDSVPTGLPAAHTGLANWHAKAQKCDARGSTQGDPDVHGRESSEGHGPGQGRGPPQGGATGPAAPAGRPEPPRPVTAGLLGGEVRHVSGGRPRPRRRRSGGHRRAGAQEGGRLRLARPARADERGVRGHRRALRPAPAGGRGRGRGTSAPEGGALRRDALRGVQDGLLRRAREADGDERGRRHRRDHGVHRHRLRHHRAARTARLAGAAARGVGVEPGAARQGPGRGAARDRGPCGRRLSERHGLGAGGHRPGGDGRVRGERRAGRPGPYLPAQA